MTSEVLEWRDKPSNSLWYNGKQVGRAGFGYAYFLGDLLGNGLGDTVAARAALEAAARQYFGTGSIPVVTDVVEYSGIVIKPDTRIDDLKRTVNGLERAVIEIGVERDIVTAKLADRDKSIVLLNDSLAELQKINAELRHGDLYEMNENQREMILGFQKLAKEGEEYISNLEEQNKALTQETTGLENVINSQAGLIRTLRADLERAGTFATERADAARVAIEERDRLRATVADLIERLEQAQNGRDDLVRGYQKMFDEFQRKLDVMREKLLKGRDSE